MRDHKPDNTSDRPADSAVLQAWEKERARLEPIERRHGRITFLGAFLLLATVVSGIVIFRPAISVAAKAMKAFLRNLF